MARAVIGYIRFTLNKDKEMNIIANVIAFGIAATIFIGFPAMAYQVWKEFR